MNMLTFLCCVQRVSLLGVWGVCNSRKLSWIFFPSEDDVFLQFKYLLILFSIAKLPLKQKSSIRTNDSVSVQRDSARGSAGLFLTAYLNSKEIQNQKCMQMTACFACWYFYDLGLAYSGAVQYVPSFSNINQNYFIHTHHILDLLLNKHFWGWKACNLADLLLMKALLNVFMDCFTWKDILKALGFTGKCVTQKLWMHAS